jgi:uncharacterized protein YndB with AHSA1/START domain
MSDESVESQSLPGVHNSALVSRELRDHPDGLKTIIIRRSISAPISDTWAALTEPERMLRWYLPLDGDLREGGYYVLAGNAVGEIYRCRPPREIAVSWVYGDFQSHLALRLSPTGGGTRLELAHGPVPPDMVANPTPELWGLAVSWEMALSGLSDFLTGQSPDGPAIEWLSRQNSAEREAALERGRQINDDWVRVTKLTEADVLSGPDDP